MIPGTRIAANGAFEAAASRRVGGGAVANSFGRGGER